MKHNNKQNIEERLKNIISIDKNKIEKATETNVKKINILEECQKFCSAYNNKSFKSFDTKQLQMIIDEGSGLLNTYFITDIHSKNDEHIILQLEYIVMKSTHELSLRHIEDTNKENIEINKKLKDTFHKATKLEKDAKTTYHQLKKIKQDQKSIIATIISIVLAISIIPTAVTGIQYIEPNYILPFIASLVLFGIVMISFIFSLYTEDLIKKIIFFVVLMIIICIGSWYLALNYNIELEPKDNKTNIEIDICNTQNNQ